MCARSSIIVAKDSNHAIYAMEKDKEMHEFVLKATKESKVNQRKAFILHGSGEVSKNKKRLGI
jgi:tRNA1(Val) A37 N6-methylase TrmN6